MGKDSVNFNLILPPDGLHVQAVGSVIHGTHYCQGGEDSQIFENSDLQLDVLISHTQYQNLDELRGKVVEILKMRNKDIRLVKQAKNE